VSGPCQQRVPLCHHPIQSSIEVYNDHGSDRRLCRDQSSVRCCGCHSLVNEGHSKERSSKRSEEGESRDGLAESVSDDRARVSNIIPTFSGLPLKPTNVPLRVYRFWEAEMEAERRENGLLSTSKRASTTVSVTCDWYCLYTSVLSYRH
jgi:hypothetical protein